MRNFALHHSPNTLDLGSKYALLGMKYGMFGTIFASRREKQAS